MNWLWCVSMRWNSVERVRPPAFRSREVIVAIIITPAKHTHSHTLPHSTSVITRRRSARTRALFARLLVKCDQCVWCLVNTTQHTHHSNEKCMYTPMMMTMAYTCSRCMRILVVRMCLACVRTYLHEPRSREPSLRRHGPYGK